MSNIELERTRANKLLLQNKAWADLQRIQDPEFFERNAASQAPRYLWIGCADSRVPAESITGVQPGEIFVHRNVANMVVHTDLNLLSVLEYGVKVLEVEHIIVCGHHGCGGVRAAMTQTDFGRLNEWLRNIKDVYSLNYADLMKIDDPRLRENRLIELNVVAQLMNLVKTSIVQSAWEKRKGPWLHAWVYDMNDGLLNELGAVAPGSEIPEAFKFQF